MTRQEVGIGVAMAVMGIAATAIAGPLGLIALVAGFAVALNTRQGW